MSTRANVRLGRRCAIACNQGWNRCEVSHAAPSYMKTTTRFVRLTTCCRPAASTSRTDTCSQLTDSTSATAKRRRAAAAIGVRPCGWRSAGRWRGRAAPAAPPYLGGTLRG
eukprot:scaffold17863_cov101-Isochrysis_galbana.AAC.2